jgi:hypothetical protein
MPNTAIAAQTTVTSTGPVGSGLSIATVSGDATLHLRIQNLSAASGVPECSIQIEDSVNAFTAVVPQWVIQASGTISALGTGSNNELAQSEQHYSKRLYELPSCRFNTTSAVIRPNVTVLNGTTPSLTIDFWLET